MLSASPEPAALARRLAWCLAACLLPLLAAWAVHGLSQWAEQQPHSAVRELAQGWRIASSSLQPPPPQEGTPVALPLHREGPADRQPQWVRVPFQLASPSDTVWALGVWHRGSLRVYLDGRLLAQTEPPELADAWDGSFHLGSPELRVEIPPDALAAGPHALWLRVGAGSSPGLALSALRLGPAAALRLQDSARRFWTGLRTATGLSALVVGLFLVLVWAADRRRPVYGLAGAHLLLLSLLLSPYLLPVQPLPAPWWRVLLDLADVAAKALMLATVAQMGRAVLPRRARQAGWLALGYALLGGTVDGWAAWRGLPWTDFSQPWPWWALGSRLLVLLATVALALRALWGNPRGVRLVTAALAGLSLLLWAYVSAFALVWPQALDVVDVNTIAHAGWVLWMGVLLHQQFIAVSRREQRLRDDLARQLAERTHQLQAQFESLRRSEAKRQAAAERDRLLQEMHDGLGAQLTAAKMSAQAGHLQSHQMVAVLQDCLQEMRLTVDALSVTDGDLGLLLGNLRHRMQRSLADAGLNLVWAVTDAPRLAALQGTGGRELVRILQEALANVLHHAQARQLRLATALSDDGQSLCITLSDDGCGLPAGGSEGRGRRSMRQRAQRLGATLQWLSPAAGWPSGSAWPGTEVRILLPLHRPQPPAPG